MNGPSLKQRIALELNRQIVNETAREHPLRQLFWECTLRCNMHCRHCGSDCKVSSLTHDMPFEDFRGVLESVSEAYDPHKVFVILTGGEPLMRPDIVKCGKAIYDMEFPWGIVSNGRLLSPSRIDELLDAGMHCATVSLDGFEKDHNWMRGTSDGFTFASQAIAILAKEPGIRFDVVTCVNRRNVSTLGEFKEYLISLGLKSWRLFTVFPAGRAAQDPDLQLTSEEFRSLMEFIKATRCEGRIQASYGCEGFLGEYEGLVRGHLFSCQAGLTVGSILCDGSISACPSIRSDYHQGNIYVDDFVDVWENRFSVMRDRSWTKESGKCASCKWWRWCQGNGLHLRDGSGKLMLCHLERL
ncbi:MAG: TIGR04133 family radical SAM/SPASM protein [Bacteroidia bacterium]|nr:TIGR04133 family radical SAM/SPASM protein [Bacteroidia bacterium]